MDSRRHKSVCRDIEKGCKISDELHNGIAVEFSVELSSHINSLQLNMHFPQNLTKQLNRRTILINNTLVENKAIRVDKMQLREKLLSVM